MSACKAVRILLPHKHVQLQRNLISISVSGIVRLLDFPNLLHKNASSGAFQGVRPTLEA